MDKGQPHQDVVGVCLASLAFHPLYAGAALRFQRYAPGLAQRGIKMRVFTQAVTEDLAARYGSLPGGTETGSSWRSGGVGEVPFCEVMDGLPVQRTKLPEGWRREQAYFRNLASNCEKRRNETEVVQFLNLGVEATPWVRRLRRLGIGTVFTHTLLGEYSSNPLRRALQRFRRRLPFQLVDLVVVSSSVMEQQLREMGVSTPIQTIPNGVDLGRFRPIENETERACLRQRLSLNPDSTVIMAIGPITPRKGSDALVAAFVRLCQDYPSAQLVMVGPRHDQNSHRLSGFHQQIQGAIEGANAGDRVIFTGSVSNVEDYLRAADLLVFPSHREGMGNVMAEAMACAVPVITTPFIGLPKEFGTPGIHYVLSNWETDVLAADIRRLLEAPEQRQRLGSEARNWAEENFDVQNSLDQYAALYQELAHRN